MNEVTVIILFFSGEKFYSSCLKSLKTSLTGNEEVLLIDNNSKDNTASLIKRDFPEFKLVTLKKNIGFSGGMNYGIKKTKGDCVILLNQDIELHQDFINEIIKPLSDKSTGIVGAKIYFPGTRRLQHAGGIIHPNGLTNHIGYREIDTGQFDKKEEVDYVTGAAIAIDRELIEKLGYFDKDFFPGYYEETDICYRARGLGFKVIYQPSAVIYHHEATTLRFQSQKYLRTFHRNRLRFVFKNFGLKFILFQSIRFELNWLVKNCPRSNYIPLLYAYSVLPVYILKLLFKKVKRIFSGS